MADVAGLRGVRIETVTAPTGKHTFNHLVVVFETGEEVHVPVTEVTAWQIRTTLQKQPSMCCTSPEVPNPHCEGCRHCDPARSP
jgi:hypothetical protein